VRDAEQVQVEASGDTVGEAKWKALRELERLHPGIDKSAVRFQVTSEGERGLLGVGYAPARVIAVAEPSAAPQAAAQEESDAAATVRELVERVATAIGIHFRAELSETDDAITVSCFGSELGLLIGKHGQTIDAIQYLANAIVHRRYSDAAKSVVVDAAGYRARRQATLDALAVRSAERAVATGSAVELEPMTAVERKVVHLRLQEYPGVETTSEGVEPNRHIVIHPRGG
jgi:spoIIIJ-associated protein